MSPVSAFASSARAKWSALEEWFFAPADPRAYAAFRIGYAISSFAILIDLWPLRLSLFGASGMFGGAVPYGLPVLNEFAYARGDLAVSLVFVLTGAAAICLALGVWQRASAIALYVWAASFTAAAPIAQSGFDTILRVMGFVLVVSPTVSTWSVRARSDAKPPPAYGLRIAQWQVMLIYATTAWLKAPDPFWRSGEAIAYFWMSMFARFPTGVLSHHAVLGAILTYSTLLIEISLPFLLWMRKTRFFGLFLGFSLHLGIALTSKLALFSLAVLATYTVFLEKDDFDWFEAALRRPRRSSAPGAAGSNRVLSELAAPDHPIDREQHSRAGQK